MKLVFQIVYSQVSILSIHTILNILVGWWILLRALVSFLCSTFPFSSAVNSLAVQYLPICDYSIIPILILVQSFKLTICERYQIWLSYKILFLRCFCCFHILDIFSDFHSWKSSEIMFLNVIGYKNLLDHKQCPKKEFTNIDN